MTLFLQKHFKELTPEDADYAAGIANELLDMAIKAAPTVGHTCRAFYGCSCKEGRGLWTTPKPSDTRRARLFQMEKMKW